MRRRFFLANFAPVQCHPPREKKADVDAVNNRNKPVQAGQGYNNAASGKTAFVTEINNVADSAKVYFDYALALEPVFGDTLKTPEELQSMFDQVQYSGMLSDLNATLAARTAAVIPRRCENS